MSTVSINLAPNRPVLYAESITELIDHYLRNQQKRLSPRTIHGYRHRLRYFNDWWLEEGPQREWLLDEGALDTYARSLRERSTIWGEPLSWHSRSDALKRLRQMLRWAYRNGYISLDFAQYVPRAKGAPPPRLPVALESLAAILDACVHTQDTRRNQAIIAVLAGTGIRCEECAALNVDGVTLYADCSGHIQLPKAKGDKLRSVALDRVTGAYLTAWLNELPYSHGPLFPSRKRRNSGNPQPLSGSGLYKILVEIVEIAGVRDEVRGAHDFRRMFATMWARAGGALELLQRQLGHASIQTTAQYILRDTTEVYETMRDEHVSPMAQLHRK